MKNPAKKLWLLDRNNGQISEETRRALIKGDSDVTRAIKLGGQKPERNTGNGSRDSR